MRCPQGEAALLIVHIGSPKTGTTALQGFLKTNRRALQARGVNFVAAGRRNIAHNGMVRPLLKGGAGDIAAELRAELSADPDLVHVMSSEVFFQPGIAAPLAEAVGAAGGDVRVVGYVRRPDRFAEAMYKQKVKNGRIPPDPTAFLRSWGGNLRYMPILRAFAAAFGAGALRLRPFERARLAGGDVVADFAAAIGLDLGGLTRSGTVSNRTLSRAVSEHLGRVNRHTAFNTRVMIREISAEGVPETLRGDDVFDKATRASIVEACADDIAEMLDAGFEGFDAPFDLADLAPEAPDRFPTPKEALQLERAAADAVMAAIGRQAAGAKSP